MVSENGGIIEKIVQIYGRKIPLLDIRERLMKQHEAYSRQTTDAEVTALSRPDILQTVGNYRIHLPPDLCDDQLLAQVALSQRTCTLALWHDHFTILQTGYILFAVWVIYDTAGLTQKEYVEKYGKPLTGDNRRSSCLHDCPRWFFPIRPACFN